MMHWGEIILLWVAGLWTLLVSVVLILGASTNQVGSISFVRLVLLSLPVWIICGLIWVTIYGRSRRLSTANTSMDMEHVNNDPILDALFVPMHGLNEFANHSGNDALFLSGWGDSADLVDAQFSSDEIEKLATDKMTLRDVRQLLRKFVAKLRITFGTEKELIRALLRRSLDDLRQAGSRINNIDKLAFDDVTRRNYLVGEIEDVLELATFLRDGVKMLRPLKIASKFEDRFSRWASWDHEIFIQTLDKECIKGFLEYFERMDNKAIHARLSSEGYLPMSEAMKNGGVAELLGRIQHRSIPQRIWDEWSSAFILAFIVAALIGLIWMFGDRVVAGITNWSIYLKSFLVDAGSFLDDAERNGWPIALGVVVGLPMLIIIDYFRTFRGWHPLKGWLPLMSRDKRYPHQCKYCHQRFGKEDDANTCCLSASPTWRWVYQHRVTSKENILGYAALIFLVANVLLAPFFEWNYFYMNGLAAWVTYDLWKTSRLEATCTKCKVLADYYNEPSDVLCSRCYASAHQVTGEDSAVGET